eukprot:COSAG01_NODE_4927_length_4613_cov_1.410671_7_plen_129_part_00
MPKKGKKKNGANKKIQNPMFASPARDDDGGAGAAGEGGTEYRPAYTQDEINRHRKKQKAKALRGENKALAHNRQKSTDYSRKKATAEREAKERRARVEEEGLSCLCMRSKGAKAKHQDRIKMAGRVQY